MQNSQAHEKSFRREQRHKISRSILFRLSGESDFKPAWAHNVSHHGLFMQTSKEMLIGEEAEVIISPFDSQFDPVQVTVEVVHRQTGDSKNGLGYGCKVTSSNIIENIEFASSISSKKPPPA